MDQGQLFRATDARGYHFKVTRADAAKFGYTIDEPPEPVADEAPAERSEPEAKPAPAPKAAKK